MRLEPIDKASTVVSANNNNNSNSVDDANHDRRLSLKDEAELVSESSVDRQ